MNKASKHIQSGVSIPVNNITGGGVVNVGGSLLSSVSTTQKNVINSIMSFLPDNRPITSLQIVEDYERCPKNFMPINRTYDQDADADLWRDSNILFGRQTSRYLCLSKTEGLPDYVVETLKVVADKMQPKEFSLLVRTADSEHKAWRKKQIAYKLSKRGTVTHAVTDIILCSKLKIAPDGFKLAGDINGVLVCYKTGAIPIRQPPPVPLSPLLSGTATASPVAVFVYNNSEVEKAMNRLNLNNRIVQLTNSGQGNRVSKGPLPPVPADGEHDYEEILASYQIKSPQRPAPPLPAGNGIYCGSVGTLGAYTELEGVPFVLNPALKRSQANELPTLPEISALLKQLDYDFHLERQTLCTMKSSASKNPFFK